MPIYEYKAVSATCDYCKDGFELLQRMGEVAKECPVCKNPCTKVMSKSSSVIAGSSSSKSESNVTEISKPSSSPAVSAEHKCGAGCSVHGYAKKLLDKKIKAG